MIGEQILSRIKVKRRAVRDALSLALFGQFTQVVHPPLLPVAQEASSYSDQLESELSFHSGIRYLDYTLATSSQSLVETRLSIF